MRGFEKVTFYPILYLKISSLLFLAKEEELTFCFVLKVFPVSHVIAVHRPRAKKEEELLLDAREGQRGAEARPQVKVPPGECVNSLEWPLGI